MDKNKLRFRNKIALSYFSTRLTKADELITNEIVISNVLKRLKSLNISRTENADIIKKTKLIKTAK